MKIKELFSSEKIWTQGTMARDKNGYCVSPRSPTAISFCLFGAIDKCYKTREQIEEIASKLKAHPKLTRYFHSIASWNDARGRKFEQVKKLIEELDI